MIRQREQTIYTELSKKYNLPYQVIEVICNHPFKFANTIIANDNNIRPIMFSYLFKIKKKKKFL